MRMMLSRLVLGAGVAAALMLWGPEIGHAQPGSGAPAPSAATKQEAKRLVDEGIAAQNAKDYDKAIDLYRRAFALVPHPILLFNVGQAHRLAGRPDQAVPFYERYLAADPNGSEAAAARAALAAIKAAAPTGGAPRAGAAPKPAEATGSSETTRPAETRPAQATPAETRAAETTPAETTPAETTPAETSGRPAAPPPVSQDVPPKTVGLTPESMPALEPDAPHRTDTVASSGRTLRLTGIVLGGAGLASAVVGVYFTTRVRHWEAEAELEGAPYTVTKPKGEAAQLRGDIAYALAGGLAIGGAVTYWLGYRKDRDSQTTAWVPVVGAGVAGIALTGSLP
jgi:tetratricopeptide (TPR) repeat protein